MDTTNTVQLTASKSAGACCDHNSKYYALGNIEVRPHSAGGVWLTATDGRCLSIAHDAHGRANGTHLMPYAALPQGRTGADIILNGEWRTTTARGKVTVAAPVEEGARFPRLKDCLPAISPDAIAVRIDAGILANLATAISDDMCVTLLLTPQEHNPDMAWQLHDQPIGVIGENGHGVIMPAVSKSRHRYHQNNPRDRYNTLRDEYIADCE